MLSSLRVVAFVAAEGLTTEKDPAISNSTAGDDESLEEIVAHLSLDEPKAAPSFRRLFDAFQCEPLAISMKLKRPGKRELGELTWVCVPGVVYRDLAHARALHTCV